MAHWLLRGRIAEHNDEGRARQERIEDEQHRPEQNKNSGEATRGSRGMPRKNDLGTGQMRRKEDE